MLPSMLTGWQIVAQGRLHSAEVREAEQGSFYSVITTRGIYSGLALAAIMLVYLLIQHHRGEAVPTSLVTVCVIGGLGLLVQLVIIRLPRAAPVETVFDINEQAIKVKSGERTRTLNWADFDTFDIRQEGIWLYGQRPLYLYLPKRFFAAADLSTLSQFLSTRLKAESAEQTTRSKILRMVAWMVVIAVALFAYQLLR